MLVVTIDGDNLANTQLIVAWGSVVELWWDSELKLPYLIITGTAPDGYIVSYSGNILGPTSSIWPFFMRTSILQTNDSFYPTEGCGTDISLECSGVGVMTIKVDRILVSTLEGTSVLGSFTTHLVQRDTNTRLICRYDYNEF